MFVLRTRVLMALFLCTALVAAQHGDRKSTSATWPEGKVTIAYGAPSWRAEFQDQAKEGEVWRLGSNMPTTLEMSCGLVSKNGPIPAGDYKLGVRHKGQNRWDLLVYEGTDFFREGLKSWTIEQGSMQSDAELKDKLEMTLSEDKELTIAFGPYRAAYKLDPIRMHESFNTAFGRGRNEVKARVAVMALPVAANTVKDLPIGNTTVTLSDGLETSWDMKLTMDGEKATLTFKNDRASAIANEKEALTSRIKAMRDRAEANPDSKEMIERRITEIEKSIEKLDREEAFIQRYRPVQTIEGTIEDQEKPVAVLDFEHERPTGGVILRFGAGEKKAVFDIDPQSFADSSRRSR